MPFAALTCVVVLLLGGPSERRAPTVPEGIPPAALCESLECAYAAAVHFIELENAVVLKGEGTELWEALSLPQCYYCYDTLAVRAENEARADYVTGGEMRVLDRVPHFVDGYGPGALAAILDVEHGDLTYHYADGEVRTIPGQVLTLIMGLQWNGSYWQIAGVLVT